MDVTSKQKKNYLDVTVCSVHLFSCRHMIEIQALQHRQKEEIESLFTRMGKPPPPSVLSPAVAMAGGRRRRKSHRSARSSGQPSPMHLGKDGELAFQYYGSQDNPNSH